ncbi:MAG: 4-hydroxy-3-methylbut-2-enyl diphosphate reductase [Sediminibacterium sp.]|nr:4-hydroxy-3-methylbut-2-enyl diphosphate reductase [Sediminibacterium sp.]
MKKFNVPNIYKSEMLSNLKQQRKLSDPLKKDYQPSKLVFKHIEFYIARHFGFCYGVENAIEIAFQAIEKEKHKNIYLLSEMIHNPQVNHDLQALGIKFIQDTDEKTIISWDELSSQDIVIIPAFGTSIETERILKEKGVDFITYNTTCPFVEKVWNRSAQISVKGFTLLIHGKPSHEETRASFSHIKEHSPVLIIKDINEAKILGECILNDSDTDIIRNVFKNRYSQGFDFINDLKKIGVVNQTTQLAFETVAISQYLKKIMQEKYGEENISEHFADTKDTLCYATNDNQTAVWELVKQPADCAFVIGGAKSSNTSHLVEICEQKLPTYFIENEESILEDGSILHINWINKEKKYINNILPKTRPLKILITSGASCPDAIVERVIYKLNALAEIQSSQINN